MRKIAAFLGSLFLSASAFAANEGFNTFVTGLGSSSALVGTEGMVCVQSGASTKCTPNQLLTFINANGTPNVGSATGTLSAANGGTGEAGTITGVPYFNGTSAATAATAANLLGALGVVPLANGGNNSTNGSTLATNATGYTLSNVSGNITSGTTGFGENWVGIINDVSAVDGILSSANITCTLCTATSYLVDWKVGGTSVFSIDTTGSITSTGNSVISPTSAFNFSGRGKITSPASNQIQIGPTNSASPSSQTLSTQGSRGGTDSNVAGGNLTIQSGLGTGNATGSALTLQVPAPGTAGTAQETAYTELNLTSSAIAIGDSTNHPAVTVNGVTTLAPAANNYSLQNTTGSITSGTTGFGENWVGIINDVSAVDGILSFANITCTLCTATSYLVDWQVGGTSQFRVSTTGVVTSAASMSAPSLRVTGAGPAVIGIYSPATNQLGFSTASTAAGIIDAGQHWRIGANTPTISSGACGATTNGTLSAASSDQSGEVIIASAATTLCTITFGIAYTTAPRAVILQAANSAAAGQSTNVYVSSIVAGSFVITGTALASTSWYYWVQ